MDEFYFSCSLSLCIIKLIRDKLPEMAINVAPVVSRLQNAGRPLIWHAILIFSSYNHEDVSMKMAGSINCDLSNSETVSLGGGGWVANCGLLQLTMQCLIHWNAFIPMAILIELAVTVYGRILKSYSPESLLHDSTLSLIDQLVWGYVPLLSIFSICRPYVYPN